MRMIAVVAVSVLVLGCSSPTTPSGSSQRPYEGNLTIRCEDRGINPLICLAVDFCGSTVCNIDVTGETDWAVADQTVIRQQEKPNFFVAVSEGDTVVTATNLRMNLVRQLPVSVFHDTAPLPTSEVWGRVTEANSDNLPVQGAVIKISGALIGTRTTISGQPPSPKPGYFFLLRGSNGFQFFGVPKGTYELTIEAPDYVAQTRTLNVTSTPGSWGPINFELVRR